MTTTTTQPDLEKVKALATDLRTGFPRSAKATLGGYVIAARAVDKGRAEIAGWNGDYHYDCPLTHIFTDFAGIDTGELRAFLATGADDAAVDAWIRQHAKQKEPLDVAKFNNEWREKRLSQLDDRLQLYMEQYMAEFVPPAGAPIYTWFDVYDVEEGRIKAFTA